MNPSPPIRLSEKQLDLIHSPLEGTLFLEGPAGCGKTTVGVERLLYLMAQGVPAGAIPLLVPQHTPGWAYYPAPGNPRAGDRRAGQPQHARRSGASHRWRLG